jgi:hypothetical protein
MLKHLRAWVRRATSSRCATPVMDPLERRALLSAVLSPDGVLTVTGTAANDAFSLRLGTGATPSVNVDDGSGALSIFRLSAVQSVKVVGDGGADTLTLDTTSGLLSAQNSSLAIRFDGGAGADTLRLTGNAAGQSVTEVVNLGTGGAPDAGEVVSRSADRSQTVIFSGIETLADTATATSLTVNFNDSANVVEVVNGPVVSGAQTGTIRAFDVTPCPTHTAAAGTTTTTMTAASAPASAAVTEAPAAATDAPMTRKERAAATREAKRLRAAARKAARAAARAARAARASGGAAPMSAAAVAAPPPPPLIR